MLRKIIRNDKMPTVSMGVACPFELATAMRKMEKDGCPMVGVVLIKDGCEDTSTDLEKVLAMLRSKSF